MQLEEEVEVVNSIYEDCLTKWADCIYTVSVPDTKISLRMSFHGYPESKPLIYDGGVYQDKLEEMLETLFISGEEVIFSFIDEARELEEQPQERFAPAREEEPLGSNIEAWTVSEEVKDRGSVFVGRVLATSSEREALGAIARLVTDKRLSRASHNMSAWRIVDGDLQTKNCDDDGETAAGSRILHLLDITGAKNCVVVVSRWFGGTHLGPARFKHINVCARDALLKGGFI